MKFALVLYFIAVSALAQTPVIAPVPKKPNLEKKLKADDSSGRREFSDEELQNKFFNSSPGQKKSNSEVTQISLPVYYERMTQALTQVEAKITNKIVGKSEVLIDAKALKLALKELVIESWVEKLPASTEACIDLKDTNSTTSNSNICWVDPSVFNNLEVKIDVNDKILEIRIYVPAELRTLKMSSLLYSGASLADDEPSNSPNWFSSYLNLNLTQNFRSNAVEYKNGREPFTGYYSSGSNFGGLVIEANARSIESIPENPTIQPSFVREDVRAVLNFPSTGERAQLGDLAYPVRSFQAYRALAGASLFTLQGLRSSLTSLPSGSYELYLKRPSKVAVYINEELVQTLSLPAGRHNLRDFPFTIGLNDLRLEITDDLGVTEVQNYSYFSSNELLKQGEQEISYAAGVPWKEDLGNRVYDSTQTTFSGFHRFGLLQNLTLGLNLQTDKYQSLGGAEFLFSTPIGYFSLDPAYSRNEGLPDGYAARLRYVVQDTNSKEKNGRFTSYEAATFSEYFSALGNRSPTNPTTLKFQANHTRALTKKSNASFGFGYNINRKINELVSDSYTISVGTAQRWFDGFSTNFSLRHTRNTVGREEISTLLFLIWTFPKDRQYVTASSESSSNTSRLDWSYQPSSGSGGLSTKANVQNKQTGPSYGESLDYNGNRFRLSQAHQVDIIKEDLTASPPTKQKSVHATNLQMGTAVVYAGGQFAISRPVTDSFAILAPLKNMKNQEILINPQKDGTFVAETDWLGPAVLPELPSYSFSTILLSQKNNTIGSSLPQDHFSVSPTYKSGYLIPIGTDANIYLKTILQNEDDKPVSMVAGLAYYLDDTSKPPVTVFTNRNGIIRSEGFYHGRYRLEILESNFEPFEFTIPEEAPNDFEIPLIKLKVKK